MCCQVFLSYSWPSSSSSSIPLVSTLRGVSGQHCRWIHPNSANSAKILSAFTHSTEVKVLPAVAGFYLQTPKRPQQIVWLDVKYFPTPPGQFCLLRVVTQRHRNPEVWKRCACIAQVPSSCFL